MPIPLLLGGVAALVAGGLGYRRWLRVRRAASAPTRPLATPAPQASAPPSEASPAPAIAALLAGVDERWPRRGRWSDGILGEGRGGSDHAKGNALDITLDPVNGPNLGRLAESLFADPRTAYVIWANRIRFAGGEWHPYCEGRTSCNPHTRHLHLTVKADQRDDTRPWELGS